MIDLLLDRLPRWVFCIEETGDALHCWSHIVKELDALAMQFDGHHNDTSLTLPPGLAKLATRPDLSGSPDTTTSIAMIAGTFLALPKTVLCESLAAVGVACRQCVKSSQKEMTGALGRNGSVGPYPPDQKSFPLIQESWVTTFSIAST